MSNLWTRTVSSWTSRDPQHRKLEQRLNQHRSALVEATAHHEESKAEIAREARRIEELEQQWNHLRVGYARS